MKVIQSGLLVMILISNASLFSKHKKKKSPTFTKQELTSLMHNAVETTNVPSAKETAVPNYIYSTVANELSKYHVTGWGHNLGSLFNTPNPILKVHYKDDDNKIKERNYKAELIVRGGFNVKCCYSHYMFFFTDTNVDHFEHDETIEIDGGFRVAIPGLPLGLITSGILQRFLQRKGLLSEKTSSTAQTFQEQLREAVSASTMIFNLELAYLRFKNSPGGVIIFNMPIGFSCGYSTFSGGTLTVVE